MTSILIDQLTIKKKYIRRLNKITYKGTGEENCRKIFEELTGYKFISVRPNFLKNPLTGYNLELDGYCEELKIAWEYQGIQHYEEGYFGNDLKYQQWKDEVKRLLCIREGIILITIPYTERKNLKNFIKKEILKFLN
jgi:hypothetical protein